MTCCHFFCSAVFSIPVCRYPTVVSARTTVSPESSSTSRSTPCVLGCCGPILTVIVSLRSSEVGISSQSAINRHSAFSIQQFSQPHLHQLTDGVDHRPVHFLHASRGRVGDVHVNR